MTNIWKKKVIKTNPPQRRYAIIQDSMVVNYFSSKEDCDRVIKHLRGGGSFSGAIPSYMLNKRIA